MEQEVHQEMNNVTPPKERHGCVTAWLILMIVANSITAVAYLFTGDMIARALPGDVSTGMILFLGVIGLANVMFSIMLFQWKKLGFFGFCGTSVIALIMNMMMGMGIGQSVTGLLGIAILYGVLQIRKNDVSAWENMA